MTPTDAAKTEAGPQNLTQADLTQAAPARATLATAEATQLDPAQADLTLADAIQADPTQANVPPPDAPITPPALAYLATDLPLLFELEPATGRLRSAPDPRADAIAVSDLVDLIHPEDQAGLIAAIDAARQQGLPRFQLAARLVRADGTRPVLIYGTVMGRDAGTPVRYLCAITDNSAHAMVAERFQLATAASTDVIFLLDFDTHQHWWSAAFTAAFGHAPLNTPDAVERWFDLVHPGDHARIKASHAAGRASANGVWQDEYRLRKADGSYATVIDRARFFHRADGSVARSISTLTDVTALREVEELFRQTAEAAQDVIYNHDLRLGTLWLNDALQTRFGYDPSAYFNDPFGWADLVFPADRPGFLLLCEQASRGRATRLELSYKLRHADGSYHAVIDRGQILRDEAGHAVRIVGSVVDVTLMRQEEERLRAVVEVASDAVYEYDVVAGVFYYADGMERTFGHDWSGPIRALTTWVSFLHPDEAPALQAEFQRFLASTDRFSRMNCRFLRADGSWARVQERMVALRDDKGRALRVVGGIEDVTAEYDAEDRLRQAQKLEAIGKLTGGVAHDFNNLLTLIIGSAALLEDDPTLGPEHRELARNMAFAARRGAELTSGLLSFARQHPLAPRALDTGLIFAELTGLLRRTLPADVVLDTRLAEGLWLAEADPTQLNAALLNLCVNAADAMPKGGRITLESRNWVANTDPALPDTAKPYFSRPHFPQPNAAQPNAAQPNAAQPDTVQPIAANLHTPLTDPDLRPGDYLRIDITDTGQGMAADVASRAFEPFFTTKPLGKGSGLGLSMVYGFARQSGGHAKIHSAPGQGTTVTLFLPRSAFALRPADPLPAPEIAYGHGEHVLVVEDDPHLRRFVVAMVERLHYRVSQAEDGDHALRVLRASPDIDLLFADVVMPGSLSGRDLAARAQKDHPGLLVLFTSGYSEGAIQRNGRLDEGVHFLAKPYQLRDLGAKLHSVFATRLVRDQDKPLPVA